MWHNDKVYPLTAIPIPLAFDATFITYRDEVGNISTSRIITDLIQGRKTLEVKPRFPLFGQWNSSFEVAYHTSLEKNVTRVEGTDKYIMKIPIFTMFGDINIRRFNLEVVLPQGAK